LLQISLLCLAYLEGGVMSSTRNLETSRNLSFTYSLWSLKVCVIYVASRDECCLQSCRCIMSVHWAHVLRSITSIHGRSDLLCLLILGDGTVSMLGVLPTFRTSLLSVSFFLIKYSVFDILKTYCIYFRLFRDLSFHTAMKIQVAVF